ncbi:hypothetical protein LCGC14_2470110 [marine sediment metagenome]|uniref:Uncharacterized protein n=1 Tax=marine sediment metagenome TaxID=412755 RepID=A0A0F9BAJ5_9ZZZZ
MTHEYTKEEFEKQVKIGVEYAVECEMDEEQIIAHLTGHLWGTVGMVLQNQEREHVQKLYDEFGVKKEYTYNEPARVREDESEIEGEDARIY